VPAEIEATTVAYRALSLWSLCTHCTGTFPCQVRLGVRAVGLIEAEIEAWVMSRTSVTCGENDNGNWCHSPLGGGLEKRALGGLCRAQPRTRAPETPAALRLASPNSGPVASDASRPAGCSRSARRHTNQRSVEDHLLLTLANMLMTM
jgi:predicted DNA-binding transcriptional regulator AlpA